MKIFRDNFIFRTDRKKSDPFNGNRKIQVYYGADGGVNKRV